MDLEFLTKYAKKTNPLELNKIKELTENKEFYIVSTNLISSLGSAITVVIKSINKKSIFSP